MRNEHQQSRYEATLPCQGDGEAEELQGRGMSNLVARQQTENSSIPGDLFMEILDKNNLQNALKRVEGNKGKAGVDEMTVEELRPCLRLYWPEIKKQLLTGSYQPKPVRSVNIPKAGGGERILGIPTVLDRFIQQSILQILQKYMDPQFSAHSYGFRPGRSAHQAIKQAQQYVEQGYRIVVDIDLEKFFDQVNHDKLMSELAKRIHDKRVLKLIRRYLQVGTISEGMVKPETEGTPQGGPLSPFLSNIMLDLLDKELERRGHKFVRYADDCNIYVRSERAGQRVMESIDRFITQKLKLKINRSKSAVATMSCRSFLGFTISCGAKQPIRRIAPVSIQRFKDRVRKLTAEYKGVNINRAVEDLSQYLRGWINYYGLCQTPSVLRILEQWVRRRLRSVIWQQWKTSQNRYKQLVKRGIDKDAAKMLAASGKGSWPLSHNYTLQRALPNSYFDSLKLPKLVCYE